MIALFLVAGLLQAAPADAERTRVETLLSARHALPAKAMFEKAAADPRAHVLALAADPKTFPPRRHAALAALRYWPDADARRVYRATLKAPKETLRHRAIMYYADAFGAAALDDLTPLLSDADVQIRLTVVEALGLVGGARAGKALHGRLAAETNAAVQAKLTETLRALDRASARIR